MSARQVQRTGTSLLVVAELLGVGQDRLTGKNTVKVYARHGIELGVLRDARF